MMTWVIIAMLAAAIILGAAGGRMDEVSAAALGGCSQAVKLCFELAGAVCLWSGVMKVADRAGITEKLSGAVYRLIGPLFRNVGRESAAMRAISLNVTSNLLGLGNAATPFGLRAMEELDRLNGCSKRASDQMILFAVINSAALQLVPPASVSAIRLAAGSAAPLDILPAVWLTSAASLASGIAMALLLAGISRERGKRLAQSPRGRAA